MNISQGLNSFIIQCIAFLIGVFLIWLGIRGRRIGGEPRCRKCGYNLTGAASPTCPECGCSIGEGVVLGVRKRRRMLLVLGVLILLPPLGRGAYKGYEYAQTLDRYHFYPFSWVMTDARNGIQDAAEEVLRRLSEGKLNESQRKDIGKIALKEQATPIVTMTTQIWINMLELLYQEGSLSEAQVKQYLEQIRVYTLVVRDQVCEGEPIPILADFISRGPHLAPKFKVGEGRFIAISLDLGHASIFATSNGERINDAIETRGKTRCAQSGNSATGSGTCGISIHAEELPPGEYTLTLIADEETFADGATDLYEDAETIHHRRVELNASFEILAGDTCDTVKLVDDASLKAAIIDAIKIGPVEVSQFGSRGKWTSAGLMVQSGSIAGVQLPIDLAFEILLRVGDEETSFGTTVLRSIPNLHDHVSGRVESLDAEMVDVIMRTSPEAARNTVDVTKIWDGEIVFEDVPVQPNGQAARPRYTATTEP